VTRCYCCDRPASILIPVGRGRSTMPLCEHHVPPPRKEPEPLADLNLSRKDKARHFDPGMMGDDWPAP